jgi:hypothetical protein
MVTLSHVVRIYELGDCVSPNRSYAVARSNATLPALRQAQDSGSMVLPISSVVLFSLAERKKNNNKEDNVLL